MCIEQWTTFPCGHTAIRIQGCLHQQQTDCHPPLCPFYQVTFLSARKVFKSVPDQRNQEFKRWTSQLMGGDEANGEAAIQSIKMTREEDR
ncbi:hypothetical protein EAF04_009350 [Stromatinia cepivora]|nr:hypothetical protein EAF04_009350 [Stromatinia cepivora]